MTATIIYFDPRFADRKRRLPDLPDAIASAFVRAGVAAPVDPSQFAALNVGGALDPLPVDEITMEVGGRMVRLNVPASVSAVARGTGIAADVDGVIVGGIITPPTLGTLSLSGTLTQGTSASGVTISGATSGSTIALNVAGLTVSGSGATRTVSGTPTASGQLVATETLAGAVGSPKQTTLGSVAAAGSITVARVGQPFSYTFASPGPLTGNLPAGLTYNSSTGAITGTPTGV